MNALEAVTIAGVGVLAGTINTVVGSGTLITFPVLLAFGYPPVTANVSNGLGLVPGSVSGAVGYRKELTGQRARLLRLAPASAVGGAGGAVLLLTLPPGAFTRVVPILIGIALVLVIIQPWLARRLAARASDRPESGGVLLWLGILATGVYGGYFGAAQGVLLLGLMGIMLTEPMQRLNASKNVLTAIANLVSGIVFAFVAHVAWLVVLLIAGGSAIGGVIGARVGRRLPPVALRTVIVIVGIAAIVRLLIP
ncbi:MAG TPA: sulfite exporter TauE/SafE family protein [Pseudonocardiaceae bacterium]|nr:sulfite exporter TauE/SafE family protein [Pseudonocardiaceae bacterium]